MSDQRRIYLDYAATTPMLDVAKQACMEGFQNWANPSSPHANGRAAQSILENARGRFKAALDWDGEVIFTSCASEAIAIAINHSKLKRFVVSPIEHDAVLRLTEDSGQIAVDLNGVVVPMKLNHMLKAEGGPALVIVQSVNNETGVMQDISALTKIAHDRGSFLLADCSQSAGKMPLPDADMIVIAAHKFGGPPGVGALLVRDLSLLDAIGGQEQGYRPGTQNLPYIMAMTAALEAPANWAGRATELRQHLDDAIKKEGGAVIAESAPRIATLPATICRGSRRIPS